MMSVTLISPRSARPAAQSQSLSEGISSISKLRLLKYGISIYRFMRTPKYTRHSHYEINHQNLSSLKYDKLHVTCITIAGIALDVRVSRVYEQMFSWVHHVLASRYIIVLISDVHRMLLLRKQVLSSLVSHELQSKRKIAFSIKPREPVPMNIDHHQDLLVVREVIDLPVPGEGGVAAAELSEGVHVAAAVLIYETVHWELVQSLSGAGID